MRSMHSSTRIKLGFDPKWVQLAMETITTALYSVLINGEPGG